MTQRFGLITTPGYERDAWTLTKRNPELLTLVEELLDILEQDPYNRTKHFHIRKLTDMKPGQGQWRIKESDYRLRYDIFGQDVVLYSFRHRREAY